MSTQAIEVRGPATRARISTFFGAHALTISTAATAVGLLVIVTSAVGMVGDSWLALVAGREVADHGLPSRDHIAVVTLGRRWIDQQWLGQLALFELHRVTRDYFPVILTCVVSIPAMLVAVTNGRRTSSDAAAGAAALLAVLPFLSQAAQARTQSFAYALFAILLCLLRQRQTWAIRLAAIGIIVLWANLHGSVVIGVGVATLRWTQDARLHRLRTAVLVGTTGLAALCSPYALELPRYYRDTAFNPTFAKVLSQWQPLGFTARQLPTWLLVVATVWLVGRSGARLRQFESAVLIALAILTIHSVRTVAFLALAAFALLPALLERGNPAHRAPSRFGVRLAAISLAVGALLTVVGFTHVRFSPYSPQAASVAARTAGSDSVFVSLELGDWLLWANPGLRGRVSADARAELLTSNELERYAALWKGAEGWPRTTSGYRTLVVSPTGERRLVSELLARPDRFRVAYRDPKLAVFVRA